MEIYFASSSKCLIDLIRNYAVKYSKASGKIYINTFYLPSFLNCNCTAVPLFVYPINLTHVVMDFFFMAVNFSLREIERQSE